MSPEQQRVCIAEACGWTDVSKNIGYHPKANKNRKDQHQWIPDYLNDLNAMHEAEEFVMKDNVTQNTFTHCLEIIIVRDGATNLWSYPLIHASASQRAEALLKVLRKCQ